MSFFIQIIIARMCVILVLWIGHYLLSTLIDSLQTLICLLFLFIWIIAADIFVFVQKKYLLFVCEMVIKVYQVHWLLPHLLIPMYCFSHVHYCSWLNCEYFTSSDLCNDCKLIIIIYTVHWLILYSPIPIYHFFAFWVIVACMCLAHLKVEIFLYI